MSAINKYIVVISLLFSALFLCSCEDYLDEHPDNIITLDMVFEDVNRLKEWRAYMYSLVADPMWVENHDYGFGILADETQVSKDWVQFNWWPYQGQVGEWSASSGPDYWTEAYKRIRSCYLMIQNVKQLSEMPLKFGYKADEDVVEGLKLESRFLIAYYYTYMLELYGAFPLITELTNPDADLQTLLVQRTPQDEILAWLDAEFVDLSTKLPTQSSLDDSGWGRPTKGMALACRARMWLFAASKLFNNDNSIYKNLKNPDGTAIFPTAYNANKWQKAKEATEELLNLGEYNLYTEYNSDGTVDAFMSLTNLFYRATSSNTEIIFGRPSSSGTGYTTFIAHCLPKGYNNKGNNGYAITQNLVDAFYTRKGLPIDKDPDYKDSGKSTSTGTYNTNYAYLNSTSPATPGLITTRGTFNMYVDREPRFYLTVTYNDMYLPSYGHKTEFYNNGADGKGSSWDYSPTGYLNKKMVHPNDNPRTGSFAVRPLVIMRLAEFYLNYAEILNEIGFTANKETILKYVNYIRRRAGIPEYGVGTDANNFTRIAEPSTYEEMKTAIRNERRVELAVEGIRYRDIRRWMIGTEVYNNSPIRGMNILGDATTFYNNPGQSIVLNRTWYDKYYLWPIPLSVTDKNSKIVQNYQWSGSN